VQAEVRKDGHLRPTWELEQVEGMRQTRQPEQEGRLGVRDGMRPDDGRGSLLIRPRPGEEQESPIVSARLQRDRLPHPHRQQVVYEIEDRYTRSGRQSPEFLDTRYVVNNQIDREGRPVVYSAHPPPARYAQYENIRVDRERSGRSRSPVYVKLGPVSGQYREQSPAPRYVQQATNYRSRTPQPSMEEFQYERAPRAEYYRNIVYAEEPRRAPPRYDAEVEYVQVADPQGDYVIRRPIRREPEPVYATYEDGSYTREPVYETRPPVSRSALTYEEEEYDPRNPGPPPSTTTRQVRYQ
jgi:hypothetical protein